MTTGRPGYSRPKYPSRQRSKAPMWRRVCEVCLFVPYLLLAGNAEIQNGNYRIIGEYIGATIGSQSFIQGEQAKCKGTQGQCLGLFRLCKPDTSFKTEGLKLMMFSQTLQFRQLMLQKFLTTPSILSLRGAPSSLCTQALNPIPKLHEVPTCL